MAKVSDTARAKRLSLFSGKKTKVSNCRKRRGSGYVHHFKYMAVLHSPTAQSMAVAKPCYGDGLLDPPNIPIVEITILCLSPVVRRQVLDA